jgi:ankyrin repeat protein
MLMSRGANVAVADSYGKTPLAIAKEEHHATIAQLLERGSGNNEPQTAGARIGPSAPPAQSPSSPRAINATQVPLSNAR